MFNLIKKQGKLIALLLSFILTENDTIAQVNLVSNPSFEQYTNCPQGYLHEHPDFWYQPDKGGGGYFNACRPNIGSVPYTGLGFQYAHSGFAMVSMAYYNNNANNYFQIKLSDSLRVNKNYYIEFYAVNTKAYKLGCNNISLLLSKQAVYADTINNIKIIPANPQIYNYGNPIITDTTNWVKVSGIYKAQGGEQYITLGNFKPTSQTNYIISKPGGSLFTAGYFIDDVSVIPLDSMCLRADAGKDTAITLGDSVFIGSLTNGIDSIKWLNGNTVIDSLRPGFWVHPNVTTSYILQQVVNGCFSADTVVVTVGTVPLKIMNYELRMMNEKQIESRWVTANEVNVSHFNIQRSVNGKDFITIGKISANNKSLNEYQFTDDRLPFTVDGSLYYRIESVDFDGRKQYSVIRNVELRIRNNGISIYPNPAKEQVTITCKDAKELIIVDYSGKTIYQSTVDRRPLTVNLKQLSKGVYVVKAILNTEEIKTEKLVVE